MRRQRLVATTILLVALGCTDDERAPVAPRPTPRLQASLTGLNPACTYSDDSLSKIRTVTAGCDNQSLSLPDGWTVRLAGTTSPATVAPSLAAMATPLSGSASALTSIDNPDADYFNATSLITSR